MSNAFPPYNWKPEPRPPVSGPGEGLSPGASGNTGPIYGIQQFKPWNPGETDARQVCDTIKAFSLWRFSAFGRVLITIDYGTMATRKILQLQAPVVLTIPGQFTATATPIDNLGTDCKVTLTPATAGARSIARQFVDAAAGPAIRLSDDAIDFWALTASTLTISGAAVVVPALAIVPLVAGSSLNTGSGFQEFEA
jgi:hypothetical protein